MGCVESNPWLQPPHGLFHLEGATGKMLSGTPYLCPLISHTPLPPPFPPVATQVGCRNNTQWSGTLVCPMVALF